MGVILLTGSQCLCHAVVRIGLSSGSNHTFSLAHCISRHLFPPNEAERLGKDSLPKQRLHPQNYPASSADEMPIEDEKDSLAARSIERAKKHLRGSHVDEWQTRGIAGLRCSTAISLTLTSCNLSTAAADGGLSSALCFGGPFDYVSISPAFGRISIPGSIFDH